MKLPEVRDQSFWNMDALPGPSKISFGDLMLGEDFPAGFIRSGFAAEVARCELVLSVPALSTSLLPNGESISYTLENSDTLKSGVIEIGEDPFIDGSTILLAGPFTQTGSNGVGAAAAQFRIGLPTNIPRFLRIKAASSAGCGDCSNETFLLEMVF